MNLLTWFKTKLLKNPPTDESQKVESPVESPSLPGGTTKKIHIIEDDPQLAEIYETRLKAEGYTVKVTDNGEDALKTTLDFRPDLITLDLMIPNTSGFDLINVLKNKPETKATPIIVISALSLPNDINKAKGQGADEYLIKSQVEIDDIINVVKKYLPISVAQLVDKP